MSDSKSKPASGVVIWIVLLVAFAIFLVTRYGLRRPLEFGERHPAVGSQLDEVQLQGLSPDVPAAIGPAELRGKVSLINFWGTWCPPCRIELPHIDELGNDLARNEDFQLFAVSCGGGGEPELLFSLREQSLDYLRSRGIGLPVYADLGAVTRRSVNSLLDGGFAYPTTLLLDREATIRGVWVGYETGLEKEIRASVENVLASSPAKP